MCHGGSTRLSATLLGQTAWIALTRTDAEFGENGAKKTEKKTIVYGTVL